MRSMMLALVAALLVTAGPAFAAGGEKGDVELGAYVGYGWLDDYGIFHPKNGVLYGARLGYFISSHWGLEASAQRLGTKTEYEILGLENVDMHLQAIRLNLLYNFRKGEEFRPFLTGGYGYEKTDVEGFGSSCDWGWNAGAGFRWFPAPHWNLRADGRYVRTNVGDVVDDQQENIEATLGINWVFGGKEVEAASYEPPPNHRPTVTCASERPEILPGEKVTLSVTASDPDGDPLTYEWNTTAGRVTGSGTTATLDLAGTTPPTTATITVRVSDNHGNSETCSAVVSVREPQRQAEAVSCIAGGFPANLSRLNNVDKACLDDVAQRLAADPRARVIVIGHADGHERPATVAQGRADAVKGYLVNERSIEEARITTRSAGASRPVDPTAQDRNRRVEVWFVPEGAPEPK